MAVLSISICGWAGSRFKQLPRFWLAAVVLLSWSAPDSHAQASISPEYQIKAVFLFNFTQFVEWPSATFTNADEPFCIGILGDDPFDAFLDETVRGEKANGHPLVIQRYHNVEEAKNCQLLFVSRSESKRVDQILAGLKSRNVLTVSDIEGFAKNGGVIRFVNEQNKIHFRINLEAAKNANLTISSQMLRLAEIVKPGAD